MNVKLIPFVLSRYFLPTVEQIGQVVSRADRVASTAITTGSMFRSTPDSLTDIPRPYVADGSDIYRK